MRLQRDLCPGKPEAAARPVPLAEGLSSGQSGPSELGDPAFLLSLSWLLRGWRPSSGARPAAVEGALPSATCRHSSRDTRVWARGRDGCVRTMNCAGLATSRPVSSCLVLGGHPGPALVPSALCAGGGGEACDVGSAVDERRAGRALCAGLAVPQWAGQREVLAPWPVLSGEGTSHVSSAGLHTTSELGLRKCCLHSLEAGGLRPGSGTARSGGPVLRCRQPPSCGSSCGRKHQPVPSAPGAMR